METGVRDLGAAFFKENSTWFNDICSKDLSNRPIYAVLNTYNLDMVLQLKYLTIIPRARMGYWLRGHQGEKNNCFSKAQLVDQKISRQNIFR